MSDLPNACLLLSAALFAIGTIGVLTRRGAIAILMSIEVMLNAGNLALVSVDRALAALFDDLDERGLLETTLVVCMGEFGRTPRINHLASRDHWPSCYFSLWAGAGIEPGRIIGASDRLGEHPATEPITPPMVGTTILKLAGLGTVERAKLKVLEGARVIDALL